MAELWIVQKCRVDYDDYPIGNPYGKAGPFESRDAARKWIDETYPMVPGINRRRGMNHNEIIQPVDLLSWVDSPDEARRKAGM